MLAVDQSILVTISEQHLCSSHAVQTDAHTSSPTAQLQAQFPYKSKEKHTSQSDSFLMSQVQYANLLPHAIVGIFCTYAYFGCNSSMANSCMYFAFCCKNAKCSGKTAIIAAWNKKYFKSLKCVLAALLISFGNQFCMGEGQKMLQMTTVAQLTGVKR